MPPTPDLSTRGTSPGSPAGSPCPSGQGSRPPLLSPLPLLISPASGAPVLSGLNFSLPLAPPTSYRFTLGFLPSPWGLEFPASSWQAPYLWGDANSTSSHTAILTPPPSVPLHPTSSLWGSSRLLGRQSPPPAAGRSPHCGEMLTPRLPTPPS